MLCISRRAINSQQMSALSRSRMMHGTAGESLPINGTVDPTDENYLETHNVGLQGTHCVSGSVTGIVVSTGDATVFGRIAKLTSEPKTGLTTLEKEVLRFVALIVLIMRSLTCQ